MKLYKKSIMALMLAILALASQDVSISPSDGPSVSIGKSDSVLGVYTPSSNQIFATGTIQDAVDDAKPGATIFLLPKLYYGNVVVDKSLKIIGRGAQYTIVDGSRPTDPNFGSVFAIGIDKSGNHVDGVTVALSGLTIRKGSGLKYGLHDHIGGGIFNCLSTLTMTNCIIRDNTAELAGGIANYAGNGGMSTLTLENSGIFGNTATNYGGGGVFNIADYGGTATATLSNNWIFKNTDVTGGGGIANAADYGGTATATLSSNRIFGNTVVGGYAISAGGGGLSNGDLYGKATMILNDNRIFENTAVIGGGLSNFHFSSYNGASIINLQSGSIDHNTATNPTPSGGGIYNYHGSITGNTDLIVRYNTPDQRVDAP